MKPQRVLPADVFDALELSALVHGGIGAGAFTEHGITPLCATGHRWFLEGRDPVAVHELGNAFSRAVIHAETNDPAVHAINRRLGKPLDARVPFNKWCKELNVVRGDEA